MSKRFRASIRFMLASEGGRTQNAMSGYHPQFKLGDIYTSCIIRSLTTDEVFELGREYQVELEFMFWEEYGHLVREDMPIELYEGSRLVGTGKFQKLLIYDNSKQNFQIENPSPAQLKSQSTRWITIIEQGLRCSNQFINN